MAINGVKQKELFRKSMRDETFRKNYISSVDTAVTKLLEGVRPKRTRGKAKCSQSSQMAELRDGRVDLTSPDSILVHTNLRALLNRHTFMSLPLYYQYKLVQLLPKFDQVVTPDGWIKPSSSALSNEFFAKSCQSWLERLSDSKLTQESIQRRKVDVEKEKSKLDPFKVKNFEPIWGQPLESQRDITNEFDRIPKAKTSHVCQSRQSTHKSVRKSRIKERIKTKVIKVQLPSAMSDSHPLSPQHQNDPQMVSQSFSDNSTNCIQTTETPVTPMTAIHTEDLERTKPVVASTQSSQEINSSSCATITTPTSVIVSSSQLLNASNQTLTPRIIAPKTKVIKVQLPSSVSETHSLSPIHLTEPQVVSQSSADISTNCFKTSEAQLTSINTEDLQRLKAVVASTPSPQAMSSPSMTITTSTSVIVSSSQLLNASNQTLTPRIIAPKTNSSQVNNSQQTLYVPLSREVAVITGPPQQSHPSGDHLMRDHQRIQSPPQSTQTILRLPCKLPTGLTILPINEVPVITTSNTNLSPQSTAGAQLSPSSSVWILPVSSATETNLVTCNSVANHSVPHVIRMPITMTNNSHSNQNHSTNNIINLCGETRLPSQITVIPISSAPLEATVPRKNVELFVIPIVSDPQNYVLNVSSVKTFLRSIDESLILFKTKYMSKH
ncbi:unnamed protein product [Oppiella nova]|uniref:DEUBAD domain-containing protein n=1 Tax=Oppiella nova TaxID=334625 RepID=A0A7R9QFR1_9ACAR|nr:unnamed protein product [Oppiella nova]CAG2164111.1 unnamed protein product [Oppiella nova]